MAEQETEGQETERQETERQDWPDPGRQAEAEAMEVSLALEEQVAEVEEYLFRVAGEMPNCLAEDLLCWTDLAGDLTRVQSDAVRRLATCRTPADLADLQQSYWQACLDRALECGRRMAEAPLGMVTVKLEPRYTEVHAGRAGRTR